MANNAPRIRIGTAGWSIPATSRAHFPADGHALQRYATLMNAVEINSSFYRPHAAGTYARWASLVPRGFRFSVKLPRTITQFARLVNTEDLLDGFFEQVAGLGAKLGRCVVQLPPSLVFDAVVADCFFAALRERADRTGLACEPRHASWGTAEADAEENHGTLDAGRSAVRRKSLTQQPHVENQGHNNNTIVIIITYRRIHKRQGRRRQPPRSSFHARENHRNVAAHVRTSDDAGQTSGAGG